jgi:hypothetical protein
MAIVLEEIMEKSVELTDEDRQKLIKYLQCQETHAKRNFTKGNVSPNIVWLKENRTEFAGKYVALKDEKLVGQEKTLKEAHLQSKENGVEKPLLTYIPKENEEIWGGW